MSHLANTRVAVLVLDGFEEAELTRTTQALEDAGARVDVISQERKPLQSFVHRTPSKTYDVDLTFDEARPDAYDALLLPGGALNADALRIVPQAQQFVQAFARDGKPIAAICHAPWLLVSAGVLRGRTLTSFATIADDLRNAGATYVDRAVVRDGNLVTSRQPDDIPQFNEQMIELFANATNGRQAAGAGR